MTGFSWIIEVFQLSMLAGQRFITPSARLSGRTRHTASKANTAQYDMTQP
jgi:hypothetical protein